MKIHGKSYFFKPKENTKSSVEKNIEDEELKKYDVIIYKLFHAISNSDRTNSHFEKEFSANRFTNMSKIKSNYIKTISRTKDERNDKEFLSNFMNNDSLPILPKNLHLLSDNDTNQSTSKTEKFKNLSNLMMDDNEDFSENCLIRNTEDRLILNLYTTLGRKAKEIFLEDDINEKLSKKRLLFQKLNDIKIPKFDCINILKEESYESNENETIERNENEDSENKNNFNFSNDGSEQKENKEEKKEKEDECYFKQKEKGYFNIPELINIKEYNELMKDENRNSANFWDPEIDSDFLSYINHNIVRIEDIYNKKDKEKKIDNIEQADEKNIIPINAEEILLSESESEEDEKDYIRENLKNINMPSYIKENEEEDEIPKKCRIKFTDFSELNPFQISIGFQVDDDKVKENEFISELKDKYNIERKRINGLEEKLFPSFSGLLSNNLIYRIVIRNENNEIEENERFTIEPTKITIFNENNIGFIQNIRTNLKKKTALVKAKSILASKLKMGDRISVKYNNIKEDNQNFTDIKKSITLDYNKRKMFINNNFEINNNNNNNNIIIDNTKNKVSKINNFSNSSESSSTIKNIKNEENNEKNENSKNDINNNIRTSKKEYTLKDFLSNEHNLSDKDKKKNNNSFLYSDKESNSKEMNDDKNKDKNNYSQAEEEIKNIENEKSIESKILSQAYNSSDIQSGSQKINKDNIINLTFSSQKSD